MIPGSLVLYSIYFDGEFQFEIWVEEGNVIAKQTFCVFQEQKLMYPTTVALFAF